MKKILAGLVLATCASAASAATYNIVAVESGVDNGFGFSGFHYAGNTGSGSDADGNPMTGSSLADFTGLAGVGSYDSGTGAFNLVLNLSSGGTAALSNVYTGAGDADKVLLTNPFTLVVDFDAAALSGNTALYDTTVVFANEIVCCGGATPPPNSFNGTLMSLWGADYSIGATNAVVVDSRPQIGLDLRITLTEVPVPAAAWLFGTGLIGLVGVARRKS